MSRLIDAELFRDYLFRHYELLKVNDYEVWAVVDVDEVLDNIEEVKAIPIEWIKKWCNEHNRKSLEERLLKRYGVITMLEDWEKENEKDI